MSPKDECKKLLLLNDADSSSSIEYDVNGKTHTFTFEYIIDTYMQASHESQLTFVSALKKAIQADNMGVDKFFEGMGQLLLMTHLSDKVKLEE